MRQLFDQLERWRQAGEEVVLARVVEVRGSGPRQPGAAMAVNQSGQVIGSVSGGCIEGAVVSEALGLLALPPGSTRGELRSFGYTDEEAFAVGLTCGGTVKLFLERLELDEAFDAWRASIDAGRAVAVLTLVEGHRAGTKMLVTQGGEIIAGSLGDAALDAVAAQDATATLADGQRRISYHHVSTGGGGFDATVYVESWLPSPRLVIFGAVDFAAALVRAGKLLGHQVIDCDAREVFATTDRFPLADDVAVQWPHRYLEAMAASCRPLGARDAVCVMTHDPKFDVPALVRALASDAGYIGVLGSRATHAKRVELLRAEGVSEADLGRLRAPIGLDIGASTPEEVAIAICAEIIACGNARSAVSLRESTGPIHPTKGQDPPASSRLGRAH